MWKHLKENTIKILPLLIGKTTTETGSRSESIFGMALSDMDETSPIELDSLDPRAGSASSSDGNENPGVRDPLRSSIGEESAPLPDKAATSSKPAPEPINTSTTKITRQEDSTTLTTGVFSDDVSP
jgi:hypothetical protein